MTHSKNNRSSILIKNAKVIDKNSPYHMSRVDILIEEGRVSKVSPNLNVECDHIIESGNLHVSQGWIDLGTALNDPGLEHRESFEVLAQVARTSGYTRLAPMPLTKPALQNKSDVSYLIQKGKENCIEISPIAAQSANRKGKDLNELIDLNRSGVKIFSDGMEGIDNYGILERALLYTQSFGGKILVHPSDKELYGDGLMHQGVVSTKMGILGSPAVAESLAVEKSLAIAKEVGGQLIFHCLSTKESVRKMGALGRENKIIQSTVSFHNLVNIDSDLLTFDENLKVMPPLRTEEDRLALVNAIEKDQVDAIVSNHMPIEAESKQVEFPYAEMGSIGLEIVYSSLNQIFDTEKLIDKLTEGPARILEVNLEPLKESSYANLTLFDPDEIFRYEESLSSCSNSPHLNKQYQGKVLGTILGNSVILRK